MRIDLRARAAAVLAALALRPGGPQEDEPFIPERRRTILESLRRWLARPARDAREERDAADFLARMREADPPAYQVRRQDLPSMTKIVPRAQLAEGESPPWQSAPYAPDPEEEAADEEGEEEPVPQEEPPLPELRAWSPDDPGKTPTGVMERITPEVERQLDPYLRALPRYEDEDGPGQ
jgi:hypothetical protein